MGCKQCNKKVCDSDRIVCRGFCGSAFYLICVKLDVPALDVMGMHPNNFFWMCDECSKLFLSSHFRNLVKDNDAGPKAFAESMKSMQSDIAKLASTVAARGARRFVVHLAVQFPPNRNGRRHLHNDDADDSVVVKMLVKKGADITKLSSVTFKVGVGRDYLVDIVEPDRVVTVTLIAALPGGLPPGRMEGRPMTGVIITGPQRNPRGSGFGPVAVAVFSRGLRWPDLGLAMWFSAKETSQNW
ncbi:hypothetical protein pipiens_012316 [Culex pipiens pipiens]|uniref:Zinc finger PHD-type domain-containing protein n=1 Tax=Culex pipiens pipiens TaxID=38569 RepID=A0ABD1D2T2_CULPP